MNFKTKSSNLISIHLNIIKQKCLQRNCLLSIGVLLVLLRRLYLQDLKSQLLARNASVQELSQVKEEFSQEKEKLLQMIEDEKNAK